MNQLKAGHIPQVLLVKGKESYLIEQIKEAIIEGAFGGQVDEFAFGRYDMESHPIDEALAEAQSMPFFSDSRVIFIERPYFLSSQKAKHEIAHDLKWLESYIESPSDHSRLIIFAPYQSLDQRKSLNKKLKKYAEVIDTDQMDARSQHQYINQLIQQSGYQMGESAYKELAKLTDQDLSQMVKEIEKVMLYKGEDSIISVEDIQQLVSRSLEQNIFALNDAILKQNLQHALHIYQDLLLQKESPIKLIAILLGQFRLLLQVKILKEHAYQPDDMKRALNIHPYRIKLALKSEAVYSKKHLQVAIKQLIETDFAIKRGQVDEVQSFELFIIQYCGQKIK